MPTIKIKNPDGSWKYVNEPSSNADTLDGKHADEFALKTDIEALQTKADKSEVVMKNEVEETKAIELVAEMGLITPVVTQNNKIITDSQGRIYSL